MQLRIMNQKPVSIEKKPDLKPSQDYYRLRKEGIGFIEQMGSQQWTDYNTHDPGITILEALCYAITDLAYRTGKDIKDILTPDEPSSGKTPFPDQAFFTAREILTINPWTPNDFRRILIDLDGVRNAWVFCKECACDAEYYAWCDEDKLNLSFTAPKKAVTNLLKVSPRGLYDVLLELESDPELGDLNDHKIEHTYTVHDNDGKPHPVVMEMRFPDWQLENSADWELFNQSNDSLFKLKILHFGVTKTYDVITDPLLSDDDKDAYLKRQWRNVFYAGFEVELLSFGKKIVIDNVAIRFLGDTTAKNGSKVTVIKTILDDEGSAGIISLYRRKLLKIAEVVKISKAHLLNHRNLDEDFCRVNGVGIEDVAVCADVEVTPDADIERVQARIWFEIENYFNPPVSFYSLAEMMAENVPVEDIFDGPELDNGFIKSVDLENATLKKVLRTSDIINLLMEIEGVIAVNNLLISKYDDEGNIVKGAADPSWIDGKPVFNKNKSSASWQLYIKDLHQPRLYLNFSRFLFYKNGLPFNPRMDEANDTLTQLQGEAERPKFTNTQNDLPVPGGKFANTEDYFPVQYSLPVTYGVNPVGLPSHVSDQRQAEAKQLKAYLLIYEQLLGNAFAQIANVSELFSLDPAVDKTYFVKEFTKELIIGYDEITSNLLDKVQLEGMAETRSEFLDRRNRFLNHLMARFGEQFSEYALMLTNLQGKTVASAHLIDDKISFLKKYPLISHDRARAFNYTQNLCNPENNSGLEKRITLLLGYPDLSFVWSFSGKKLSPFTLQYSLNDENNNTWFSGSVKIKASSGEASKEAAYKLIIKQMLQSDAYEVKEKDGKFNLNLKTEGGALLGSSPQTFATNGAAIDVMNELLAWSANEKAFVVEHLLLRPKFPGDALYPACSDGSCQTCGDEDPYSFRLTYVMPGWTAPFNINLDMRRFADRTIRYELPSHLLGKICWVGNDGFIENSFDPVITVLADLLMQKGITKDGIRPSEAEACACSLALYTAFSNAFSTWYEDKTLTFLHADALNTLLDKVFSVIKSGDVTCSIVFDSTLWDEIKNAMILYFKDIVLNGWQFERFEDAWCQWLKENANFDWTEERLHEHVEAMLKANLKNDLPSAKFDLCDCANQILNDYGIAFYKWMNHNFEAGREFKDFSNFSSPAISLCSEIPYKAGTAEKIGDFLHEKYKSYKKVSYNLWKVVHLLSKLKNTYPGATLHDCDDGSDQNPVRLGSTALGNYPLKRNITL
ncbi:MAG TPA: hypothetical protein VFC67_25980 [Prolixibacteraceae bacterium]|nr:hypothetical protein [Prolixibacteraceae bacterium]